MFKCVLATDVTSQLFVTVGNQEQVGLEVSLECRDLVL